MIADNYRTAFALWVLATVLWLILIYDFLTAFTVKERTPTLAEGINGGWLLAVVHSVDCGSRRSYSCALATALPSRTEFPRRSMTACFTFE